MKNQKRIADVNSPAFENGVRSFNVEMDNVDSFRTTIVEALTDANGNFGRDKAAYAALKQDWVAGRISAGDTKEWAPRKFARRLAQCEVKAPGKQGKRIPKVAEPVAATLEAWIACYKTADAKTAAKIVKQLGW